MTEQVTPAVLKVVQTWPGVAIDLSQRGSPRAMVGRIELGHLHGEHVAHLPMPRRVRDAVLANGDATPHPVFPNAGWVERVARDQSEIPDLIALFRMNYERAIARENRDRTA